MTNKNETKAEEAKRICDRLREILPFVEDSFKKGKEKETGRLVAEKGEVFTVAFTMMAVAARVIRSENNMLGMMALANTMPELGEDTKQMLLCAACDAALKDLQAIVEGSAEKETAENHA